MTHLLDSNAWIAYLRQSAPSVVRKIELFNPRDIALCSVVLGELWYGAERSDPTHLNANRELVSQISRQFQSLPFDDHAARQYGMVRAHLEGLGQRIGPNDVMIASIALANNLTVVTHNVSDFGRVPGLTLEDWQAS